MVSPRLHGRRLVLGVCGSIACYKAVSLLRLLKGEGADVRVAMTSAATKFVTPLTFETLSQHPVATEQFARHDEMVHLTWAEDADAIVIAPCTANMLAKAALGLADDLLSTMLLAARCPLVIAPAMDGGMWDHPAVQAHVAALRHRGMTIIDPEVGPLASGRTGRGRLTTESTILERVIERVAPRQDFSGRRVLISAGPTQEPLDPVRFLSNHSSGKMGYAVAEAARIRGAEVVLVTGPTSIPLPPALEVIRVTTAEEMHKALAGRLGWADLVVMAAAVADYRPKRMAAQKLKKSAGPLTRLELEPIPDILTSLSRLRTTQCMVGFSAETENLVPHAQAKLCKKGLDLIVANNVLEEGAGFGSETNKVTMIDRNGTITALALMPKRAVADRLLDAALALMQGPRRPGPTPGT